MHITTIALIISIIGLISSFFLVGIIPSLVSLVMGIRLAMEEKSIPVVRILAISCAGVLLPIIMYLNTFGFSLPKRAEGEPNVFQSIIINNYSNLGLDFSFMDNAAQDVVAQKPAVVTPDAEPDQEDVVYYTNTKEEDKALEKEPEKPAADEEMPTIFESLDSIDPKEKNKGGIVSVAPSDDDMPSYGGLPVGTLLIAQYFREDDHNANPVLVLQNKTGQLCRYECTFTARDKDGNEMATSDKTVEVVRDGSVFVFEGRFDKKDLRGGKPDAYEFSISKRDPYEKDMANYISVYTTVDGSSAILTAENKSDKKVKVDAYVLFFDGTELVDCMWMIPQNIDEVCLDPGSLASIKGDAYYRFDRVETFYTAYEAVGE
jgi:hypothetical protein